MATWRLLRAAEHAGAEHFVFFSALGATPHHPSRLHRAKALAERAVDEAALRTTTFAPSLVYAPGDRRLARLERLAWLPAVPLAGRGRARTQPIWAEDVADCVLAALERPGEPGAHARFELAGPDVLTHREVVEVALHAARRRRRLLPLPAAAAAPAAARLRDAHRAGGAGDLGRGGAARGHDAHAARHRGRRGARGPPAGAARGAGAAALRAPGGGRRAAGRSRAGRRAAAACPRRAAWRRGGRWSAGRPRRTRPGPRSRAGR